MHGSNTFAQSTAERQAINTVIQGSASEVMKVAMLLIIEDIKVHPLFNAGATGDHASTKYMNIKNTYPRPQLIMQIHDELIFELYLEPHGSCGQNRHADMDFPSESCSDASSMHRDKYVIDCFIELLRYNMEVKVQHLFNMIHMNNPNMSCHFDNISKGSAPMGLSTPSSEVPLSHVPLLINIQISDDSWGKFEIYN